jgi:WhiB family redox-sensing transcriptional regulator
MNVPGPPATDRDDWRSLSACLTEDPELFFPLSLSGPGLAQLAAAKAVCAQCQVSTECLGFALNSGQEFGVWGGMSEEDRKAIRRVEHVLAPKLAVRSAQRRRRSRSQPVQLGAGWPSGAGWLSGGRWPSGDRVVWGTGCRGLVRILVPAALALLGERGWYLPRWLGWLPGGGGYSASGGAGLGGADQGGGYGVGRGRLGADNTEASAREARPTALR